MKTFYWHDYETWGVTPSVDRPSQFAGVRTDENLNVIGQPLVIYCAPPVDIWPHPDACLVTGIVPQVAREKGCSEREFIKKIVSELALPETCGVGYNTLRFDDEVTRYTLYRNLYDPYEREWKNGNSRWDIIDMVRLVFALRPDGIEWPMVDNKPSFTLENLTIANGISHQSAHDAYSDVEATIALAKLIKQKKPELYHYVLNNRSKQASAALIDIAACKPLLHVSSKFPSTRGCAGLIAPLAMHPKNKNAVIVYDLAVDPTPLAKLSPQAIRDRVFTAEDALPKGEYRLPIKLVHLNKCPILATTKLLEELVATRLGIDKGKCELHWQLLKRMAVGNKLQRMYELDEFAPSSDPEQKLYDGFFTDIDKRLMRDVRDLDGGALAKSSIVFEDSRLQEMLFRYRARNFPDSLTTVESALWQEFVYERLRDGENRMLSFEQLNGRIDILTREHSNDARKLALLRQLAAYAEEHFARAREMHRAS